MIFILVKDVVDILFDLFFGKEEVGQVKIRALYAMWCGYLQTLSNSIKLLDKDGEISKDVTTHITKEEAKKLMKFLKKAEFFSIFYLTSVIRVIVPIVCRSDNNSIVLKVNYSANTICSDKLSFSYISNGDLFV